MERKTITDALQRYVASKRGDVHDPKGAQYLSMLSSITEEDLSFGEPPTYFYAYMTCNSTGVGRSSFQGTETQRTVALDYDTDEYLFIDGHVGAGEKGLSLFYLKPGQVIHFYKSSDIPRVAKEFGFQLHLQSFRDLNFTMHDHRLNRHTVNVTREPFTCPIRPIFATTDQKRERFTIGYLYEMDGKEKLIIEPEDPKAANKSESATGCSPWMLLSFLFPPLILVAGIVWIARVQKERMRG